MGFSWSFKEHALCDVEELTSLHNEFGAVGLRTHEASLGEDVQTTLTALRPSYRRDTDVADDVNTTPQMTRFRGCKSVQ